MSKKVKSRSNSIRTRLVKSFMIIIIITVLILEITLINGIKKYYYSNMEDLLTNQLDFSINYLSRYLRNNSLEDIIIDDIDLFWNHTTAQVQVANEKGDLLFDSLGSELDSIEKYLDVKKAIEGKKGVITSNKNLYEEPVMSISKPILINDKTIGILRFTTSMKETNNMINFISILLIVMGFIVVLISGVVSLFLANSIVKPLKKVTKTASLMADGRMDIRNELKYDDEIGKLAETLNFMADEIVKKEEIKNEFISSISHELKTPLTSIKGWAITLQSEDLRGNEILIEGLDIIEEESDRLSEMLEELLDFSKFTSGRITLNKEEIDLKDYIEKLYKQLSPRADLNDIEFELKLEDDIGMLVGDRDRLKQVLINVLDNAFKFLDENGKIILKVYRNNNQVIFEIKDNGIGIPEEELPYIKERFYKGKSSNSHTGIGLSICDEIISLHSGKLEIESKLSKGTKVTISIPKGECIDE